MAIAGAVVDRLLRRLSSNAGLLELPSNIDEGAAHVRRTLVRLQDVLVSVEMKGLNMRTEVQDWMGKIKEAAYGVEDLLDEFEGHNCIRSQRSACISKATSFCSLSPFLLHNIGNGMKTHRRKLDLLAEDSVVFSLMQHSKCDVQQSDKPGEFDRAACVGRDNDKAKIKDLFVQNDAETLCIVPIVGLVGLGKTTLARLLFHDQGDGWNFDRRIWVNLNRKVDLKNIVIDIISQANKTKEEGHSEVNTNNEIHGNLQLLKNRLRELLHGKNCLIVLDGLCSTNKSQLDELKEMLRGTNKCINILVTTSSEITSEIMHTVPPYKLLPLTEDDCWTIFSRRAFGDRDDVRACLKDIGKQIVKRCEGIPVLAHSLGSIVHNQHMDVWLAAKDEEIWKLEKIFSPKIEMFAPFNQTYYGMPSALKLCLLYLSLFPKGSIIDKEKLIWQWIALDIIGSKHETLPSYVNGEMYIEDLLSVYFLQVRKTYPVYGMDNRTNPTMLYMHNFVHDFARHAAYNDIIILDDSEMQSDNAKRLTCQYALLTNYRGQSTLRSSTLTRARALHLWNSVDIKLPRESFELLKHLRVLNLSGCCIGELPASVGHLKYLTYLDVSDLKIQALPSSMSNLTNLKALDLSKTSLKELPSYIGTFPKLQYLNLQGCEKLQNLPPTLGHLQSLEHLRLSCCYDVHELPDSLCNLHDLRFLDLSRCPELQQLPPLFGNLSNLEDLNLSGCFNLKKLPESFVSLYSLRFLNLSSCYELEQLPKSLTNVKKLEVLILRRCSRLQNLPPFFENMQYLRILDLSGCEALQVSTEILTTNLEYLNLQRCLKLQTQPNFVNFTKLKFLNLSQCLYTIDYLQALGHLFNLEYLNLSQTFLDIPVSFERLQKLHMLDLTGCVLKHPFSRVPQILPNIIRKMTGLKFVLTSDPTIVTFLPKHIRCSVSTDEHWHITSDELFVPNLTGGSRGLGIAKRANIQNRQEIRFLKLGWIPTSQSAAGDAVDDVGVEEVLEKLQPNQSLEHFELVGYAGSFFPTWMMSNMTSSLPNLVILHLFHLDSCKNLPPLCELQNLRYLHIKDMPNLINLDMGLSGGPEPLEKLTHLKLETLLNLEELCILLSTNTEEQFMFPALEVLSVVSCSKLIFKPSFPKCLKYEIKASDNILSCGEPIGPPSSSSPVEIEITGCRIPSKLLQWFRSLRTLEKAVIDSCVGEDGQVLTSLGPSEIEGNEEPSSSYTANEIKTDSSLERITSHELLTQVSAPTKKGHSSSLFQKLFPWFSTSPDHKGPLRSLTFSGFTTSEESTISSRSTVTGVSVDDTYLKGTILESPDLKVFTFVELKIATRNFKPESLLAEDGSGKVYKGWLDEKLNPSRSGVGTVVAIKKFDHAGSTDVEWQTEINFIGRLSHPSLVKLLGYCMEDGYAFLIYEFMAKGSLQNHLFRRQASPLSWSHRVKILIGAAHGLAFLHSLKRPVIHRNFKTSNILLDSSYNAKISDLSLAKDGPDGDVSHVTTRVMGTYGYAAPEYIATGHLYVKSDVYSFGVVLLEMLCGRRTVDRNCPTGEQNLVDWAKPYLTDRRRLARAMDPRLEGQYPSKVAIRVAGLASMCLSNDHKRRPSMNEVVDALRTIDPMNSKPGGQAQPTLPSGRQGVLPRSDTAVVSSRAGVT